MLVHTKPFQRPRWKTPLHAGETHARLAMMMANTGPGSRVAAPLAVAALLTAGAIGADHALTHPAPRTATTRPPHTPFRLRLPRRQIPHSHPSSPQPLSSGRRTPGDLSSRSAPVMPSRSPNPLRANRPLAIAPPAGSPTSVRHHRPRRAPPAQGTRPTFPAAEASSALEPDNNPTRARPRRPIAVHTTHENPQRGKKERQMMTSHLITHIKTTARGAMLLAAMILPVACVTAIDPFNTSTAHAGELIQNACENPNLSAAPSQGWSSFTSGSVGFGSNTNTVCGPGDPMVAELSSAASEPVGAGKNLQWTPPAGDALMGGSVDVSMNGDGYGYDASGTAVAYSPEFKYDGSDVLLQCSSGQPACSTGSSPYAYTGVLSLPSNRGGDFYIGAGCGGTPGQTCDEGASEGAWSLVRLWWARFLLSNNSTPAASNITGPLLNSGARGTQELTFTASDPGGPGVYVVTAQVDGKTLYSGTPNNNGGECVSVGNSGGVLMFDYGQPCRASESIDLPIETGTVTDGSHTLKITVEDAAQNSSVVYDGTISTHNAPVNGTPPGIEASDPQTTIGTQLSATDGAWGAPTGAGTIGYTGQWLRCNAEGNDCQPVSGASTANYTIASADAGSTLRYQVTAKNNAGSAVAVSPASAVVPNTQQNSAPPGPGGPLPGPALPTPGSTGPGNTQIVTQILARRTAATQARRPTSASASTPQSTAPTTKATSPLEDACLTQKASQSQARHSKCSSRSQ